MLEKKKKKADNRELELVELVYMQEKMKSVIAQTEQNLLTCCLNSLRI